MVLVHALFPDGINDTEIHALESDYAYFRLSTRKANWNLLPPFPFGEWFYSPRLHPFTFWRHMTTPVVNTTQVAKSWCIPQSVLFKFESQPWAVPNVPEPLLEAMVEAGHTDYECEAFRVAYASFQASAATSIKTA